MTDFAVIYKVLTAHFSVCRAERDWERGRNFC